MKKMKIKISQYQAGEIAKLMNTVTHGKGSDWSILKNDFLHFSKLTDNVLEITDEKVN